MENLLLREIIQGMVHPLGSIEEEALKVAMKRGKMAMRELKTN